MELLDSFVSQLGFKINHRNGDAWPILRAYYRGYYCRVWLRFVVGESGPVVPYALLQVRLRRRSIAHFKLNPRSYDRTAKKTLVEQFPGGNPERRIWRILSAAASLTPRETYGLEIEGRLLTAYVDLVQDAQDYLPATLDVLIVLCRELDSLLP